ncbi:MAG: class I SAM-dependent methyltransferase [bacterium]
MDFLDPAKVLQEFGVFGTEQVADFGAGAGHFSMEAAKRLDGGRLFAIDIEKEMLTRLVAEAHERGHDHVHTVWGDLATIGGVPLADHSFDKVIAVSVLFQVDDRDAFVQETKRLVKPGGKVLLVDWKEGTTFGPHHEHRISEIEALALFRKHGFEKEKDVTTGDYHYGMILIRN